jgi:hypothetical protein
MFDQLPCPILVTDRGGIVQSLNQCLLDLVGGDKDSWVLADARLADAVA